MKNSDCYRILEGLKDIKQIPYSELSGMTAEEKMKYLFHTDFYLACARNKKIIEEHIQLLEERRKPDEEFNKYQEKRRAIAREYSKKDKNKNPVINSRPIGNGQILEAYVIENINDKNSPYNRKMAELEKSSAKLIADQTAKEEQYEKSLDEVCDLKLNKIKENIIPMGQSVIAAEAILEMLEVEPIPEETKKDVSKSK